MRGSGGTSKLAAITGVDADWTIDSLTFESAATGSYTITGGILRLANTFNLTSTKVIRNSDNNTHIFDNERIELSNLGTMQFDAASGDLDFETQVRFMLNDRTLEVSGGNDVYFNGGIAREDFISTANLEISGGTTAHIGNSASALTNVNIINGTLRIASNSNLGNSVDISVASGSFFDVNGFTENIDAITGTGTISLGSGSLTLGDSNNFAFSGAITGTGNITKDQSGVLTLEGVSTYSGATNITAGTLRLGNTGSLSSSTDVSLSTGATFDMNGVTDTVDSISGSGSILLGGGSLTVDETSGSRTFIGNILETGTLRKNGGHTLTLTGNNEFTSLIVAGGTLNVVTSSNLGATSGTVLLSSTLGITGSLTNSRTVFLADGTFDIASGQSLTQSGVIQNNTTAASLTKTGLGTMVLTASNTYTGDTILNNGRLEISTASERIHNTSDLVINGGVFDLNGSTETVASLSGSGGQIDTGTSGGRLVVNQSGSTTYSGFISGSGGMTKQGNGTLTLAGNSTYGGSTLIQDGTLRMISGGGLSSSTDVSVSSGATWDLNGITNTVDSISGAGNIVLGGASLNVDQVGGTTTFSGVISGNGGISKSGSHTLVLSGNNSFTSGVLVFDGAISVSSDANLGTSSGNITLAAVGGLNTTGSFTTARTIQFGMAATGTLDTAASTTLTYSGALSGSAGNTLRKTGTGTLVLASSQNGYTGNFQVDAGTLELANFAGTAFNGVSRITVNSGGTYIQNQVEGFGSLAGAGSVVTNNTLEVGFDNTSTTFSGVISGNVGSGFVVKTGTGIWTLSGLNTYGGNTQINGGTLRLSGSGRLPDSSTVTVTSPGIWDLNNISDAVNGLSGSGTVTLGSGTLTLGSSNGGGTFSGVISETGSVVKQGTGTQTFSGSNTYGGSTTISGGRLQIANSNNLGGGSVLLASGGRLQVTGTMTNSRAVDLGLDGGIIGVASGQTLTQSAPISGIFGSLTKADPGILLLTANNTYAGETLIQAGTVQLSGSGLLSDVTDVVISSGATWNLNGISDTVDSISGGGAIQLGGGTLTVQENGGDRVHSGVISGSGALVKNGSHNLVLSGSNTFTGPITINAGKVSAASNANLGTAFNSVFLTGTLNATDSFSSGRGLSLQPTGGTIEVQGSRTLTWTGTVSGNGALNKTGPGALVLTGNNSYFGGTRIFDGEVAVGTNAALGSNLGSIRLESGTLRATNSFINAHAMILDGVGTIAVDETRTLTQSATLSGTGNLIKTGAGRLVLNAGVTFAGPTTIDDGTLDLAVGNLPDAFAVTINAAGTWNLNGVSDTIDGLFGNGTVTLDGGTLTLGAANGAGDYAGRIFGTGGLVKIGSGEQVLSSSNTHSQSFTAINGGTLQVNSNIPLGSLGAGLSFDGGVLHTTGTFTMPRNVTLNPLGGTFDVDGSTTLTVANPVTGPGGLTKAGLGTLVLQGNNNFGGPMSLLAGLLQVGTGMTFGGLSGNGNLELGLHELIVNSSGNDTFGGIISGVGGKLTKDGPGTLTLTGINTYTGGTCILDGVLRISQSENLGALGSLIEFDGGILNTTATFNMIRGITLNAAGGTIDVNTGTQLGSSGNMTGIGSLTKIGDGALSLVGGFSSYEGGTNILGGEVEINNNINLGNTIGQLTLDNGTLRTSNNVSMARLTTVGAGGAAFRTDPATTLTHSGQIVGNPGAAGVTKRGSGDLRWQGNNTFAGNIILESGRLQVDSSGQLGNTTNVLNMRGGGLHSLASMTNARAIQLENGTDTNTIEVAGGTTLTQSGVISDGAMGPPLSLTKTGTGNLLLTAANAYSSPTNIDQGVLRLSGAGRLPDVTDVTVALNSTFDLNGVNDGINGMFGDGDVTLGSGILTVGANDGNGEFDGFISGSGGIVKTGSGRQLLTRRTDGQGAPVNNTYAGGTLINGGILSVESDATLGDPAGPLAFNGGELEVEFRGQSGNVSTNRAITLHAGGGTIDTVGITASATLSGVISGVGSLTKQGIGPLTLAASNTYTGDTIVNGGLLRLQGAGRIPNESRVVVNVATGGGPQQQGLDFNNISDAINALDGTGEVRLGTATVTIGTAGGNGNFSGFITGSGQIIKDGAGLQVFAGNNTYSGGTHFQDGMLSVSANNHLGQAAGPLTFNGGTLRTTGSFATSRTTALNAPGGTIETATGTAFTHNGVISGVGGLSKNGGGVLVLGGVNTYTGSTNINAGILRLTNVERLSNETNVTVATGATFDLNNFNESINALSGSGTVALGSASLVVGINNGSGSFSGVISGTGDLLKEGTGVQTLSGQNTYSGATFVDRGELILSGGGRIDQSTTVIGFNIGSNGMATMDGAGTTWDLSGNLVVGLDGMARMNIRNGAVMTVEGDVRVGSNNQGANSAGTLSLASGTLDNSLGNGVSVINGTLQGHGTILGNVDNFSRVAPGNSAGILNITGNYVQATQGTLALEVGGRDNSNPNVPQFDVLNVSGNLALDGLLQVSLLGGFQPLANDTFTVAASNLLVGTFSNVFSGSRVNLTSGGTGSFQVNYGGGSPFGTNLIVLSDFQGTASAGGDFDGNGVFNCADVNALVGVIAAGTNIVTFDMNGDGLVNGTDLTLWLAAAGAVNLPSGNPYLFGDANLDGIVDGQDFIVWNNNKFSNTPAWCSGDFNADGVIDGQDFIAWNNNKFSAADAAASVPEPNFVVWTLVALAALLHFRKPIVTGRRAI